jgi:potassium efflux system protein
MIAIWMIWLSAAFAQPATEEFEAVPSASPSIEELRQRRATVEADQSLTDDIRKAALGFYDKAIEALQEAEQTEQRLRQARQQVASAPVRLQELGLLLQQELESRFGHAGDVAPETVSAASHGNLAEVERQLIAEQTELGLVREQYEATTSALNQLAEDLPKFKTKLQENILNLRELDEKLAVPVDPGEPGVISAARYAAIAAQRTLRDTEGQLLRYQLDNHSLRLDLARAERDLAAARVERRTERLGELQQRVQVLRGEAAVRLREQAEMSRALAQALPEPVRAIADTTVELTAELQAVTRDTDTTSTALALARGRLQEVKSDFEHTRERVRVAGATEAIGRLLRRRLEHLPSLKGYELAADKRSEAISRATDRQIDLEEALREVGDIPHRADSILANLPWTSTLDDAEFIRTEAQLLLRAQSQRTDELAQAYGTFIQQLTALDVAERELLQVAETYADFLREDLLWIRNTSPLGLADVRRLPEIAHALIGLEDWHPLVADTGATIRTYPLPFALSIVVFVLLLIARWRAPRALAEIGDRTTRVRTDSYLLTVRATGHTLVPACVGPYLMGVAAVLLVAPPNTTFQADALARGLVESAKWLLAISLLRHIVRPMGLADRHFEWSPQLRGRISQSMRWLAAVLVPLVFVIEYTHAYQEAARIGATGRLALIVGLLALAVAALRVIAGSSLAKDEASRRRTRLIERGRWLWYPLFVLLPLVVAGLSAAGFHNTAFGIANDLVETYMLVIGLILVRDLSFRWIYVNKRRLRFQDALRRREEARAEREAGETSPESELLEEPQVDYGALGDQAERLLNTVLLVGALAGLLAIWANVLPALGFLQEFHLPFNRTVLVDGVEQILPVTLQDALLSVLVVVLTFVAAKNAPGLLGIAVLRHLPLDAGGRYAFQTISQYLIVGIGIVSAFNIFGAQWSSIQWLVAALTLGLGFGLQEIVANFVSGLIMLFERPVRIGDWVTVGNTSGIVSRIKIRATTIVNWDQQELIVPNKEFITGRVLNWSLSSQVNRVIVSVGIAYGSDVKQALALLAEAAAEHEQVIEDPDPIATFEGFGDNGLTLFLRCYLDSLDYRLITISELHESINRKFEQAGIGIAFPQRDLHLETSKPLDVRLHRK